MSWGNTGLARQLEYETQEFVENYYLDEVYGQTVAEEQVEVNHSLSRVRASAFIRLFFLLFLYGMALVFVSNLTGTLGYDVVQMQGQVQEIGEQNKRLEIEIEGLKSLERVEQVATSQLGMVHSNRKDTMVISKTPVTVSKP